VALEADPAAGLIEYLRTELREPALAFSERPSLVTGGFDTRIFAFRLTGAPPACSGPLILRLLAPHDDPARVRRERVTQNALVDLGYPAPRVLWANTDAARLGGAFLVMERLPGKPLLDARFLDISAALVEMQARLHDLDAEALLRALDRDGPPLGREVMSFEGHLVRLEARIARGGLAGLREAMRWLVEHRPPEPGRRVVCHGDFHPQNILALGRAVTGVIDWPNALVADPACDVASTLTILRFTPTELLAVPAALRWVIRIARRVLVMRYLAGYRRRRRLDPPVLSYYEAASCMRGLVRVSEARQGRGVVAVNPLDASSFGERLAAHFAHVTGISPTLPPARP